MDGWRHVHQRPSSYLGGGTSNCRAARWNGGGAGPDVLTASLKARMRREKALVHSGWKSFGSWFVPPGSNRSSAQGAAVTRQECSPNHDGDLLAIKTGELGQGRKHRDAQTPCLLRERS